MSTTSDLRVAAQYSISKSSLIFAIKTKSCLQRGASLQWLSAFPQEAEYVYPPLTYLRPTGARQVEMEDLQVGGQKCKFTIIEVEPTIT